MSEDERVRGLERMLGSGVPRDAIAFYGRWWQLETWLREMVYVELRSRYGTGWTDELDEIAHKRAKGEDRNFYMTSADSEELLAYADVSALVRAHRSALAAVREAPPATTKVGGSSR